MLTCLQCQSFMTHILQCNHLCRNLFLCQFLTWNCLILSMIRTIHTTIHAVVRQIQWRKHHDSVAINMLFDTTCERKHFMYQLLILTRQQQCCLTMRQSLIITGSLNQTFNKSPIILILICPCNRCQNLLMVNEFYCF